MTEVFSKPLQLINIGSAADNRASRIAQVDYRPEALGDDEAAALLARFDEALGAVADDANDAGVALVNGMRPVLRDILPAASCVPGMEQKLILHSGPPAASFEGLGERLQRAVVGAALHEGLAATPEEALGKLKSGAIRIDSADCHSAAAADCGVISASTQVFCVCDAASGRCAYAPLPGFGKKKVSDGFCDPETVDAWVQTERELVPRLREALLAHGDLDVFALAQEGLLCGDDGCRRLRASALFFADELLLPLADDSTPTPRWRDLLAWLRDERLFANLFLAAEKCALSALAELEDATLFCSLGSNGRELGARLSGCSESWITVPLPEELLCGDEIVCELFGLGTAALAAAPVVLGSCGLGERDALGHMYDIYECASGHSAAFRMAFAGFTGSPIGVDCRKLLRNSKTLQLLALKDGRSAVYDPGLALPLRAVQSLCENRNIK